MFNPRLAALGTGVALAVVLSACSSDDSKATATPGAAAIASSTVAPTTAAATRTATASGIATASSTTGAATTVAAAKKVSANNATVAELTAAFQAAGISSADRWAREVDEYRPYPTTDANMAKLRQELAKYNPGPGVVDAIIATLQLP